MGWLDSLILRLQAQPEQPEKAFDEASVSCAALLVQMAAADFDQSAEEHDLIVDLVARALPELSSEELDVLIEQARSEAAESVSLYDFTAPIHRSWSVERKVEVIESLWSVAFADGRLDPKEEHLARKVAGLLHVPHESFIEAKKRARSEAGLS